jgi:nicotinate-nucleotide--dimethylbenzimidazole phosphoribosyltransferase
MSELLSNTIGMIKPLDKEVMAQTQARQDMLTKPQGSLGRLEELSIQLAGIQGKPVPQIRHKAIITMAGDHGVVAEKVGNWPQICYPERLLLAPGI